MINSVNIACAILAGGKNRRMGKNKAFIEIEGISIIKRNIDLLKKIFPELIIVTNSPQEYVSFKKDASIITDKIKNIGPLGGIFSALSSTEKESVFFIACDMPFLHNDMIIRQLEFFKTSSCQALIPKIGDFIEPLHAIYKIALAPAMRQYIENNTNYSIRKFLESVRVKYMPLENNPFNRKVFTNINKPQDYRNLTNGNKS